MASATIVQYKFQGGEGKKNWIRNGCYDLAMKVKVRWSNGEEMRENERERESEGGKGVVGEQKSRLKFNAVIGQEQYFFFARTPNKPDMS